MENVNISTPHRAAGGHRELQSVDRKSPSEAGERTESSGPPRLYHTLTACTRCRSRKTRCDASLPKCTPCERSGTHCEFFDSTKQKIIPRNYVVHLQNKVRALEEEVARREALLAESEGPNNEELVRGIGAVKFGDYDHYKEPRYVGSSSGVTVTRLVLESAKKDLDPQEFKDMTAKHRKNAPRPSPESQNEQLLPEAKLPPRHLGEILVSFFCKKGRNSRALKNSISRSIRLTAANKALYMLPVLHEPTFMKEVAEVYEGSTDPFMHFKLKMVLAISLQKHSSKHAALADSYFLAGLQHLDKILEPMDHSTLQCLLIMVQYALVKPTRIAAYHIVGICVRLCIQLGYHQERTIMLSEQPLDPITKDMRRRLFWTLASMEYGLSHVLGRPSAFATSDAYVDVQFYEPVDDALITAGGILPGPASTKKLISMHFFAMRRLQAEIRRTLYQNPRETPKNDQDPWFIQMYEKCVKWKASCPADDEGSGLSERWFHHRFNNIIIFMYRPSPQVPQPSPHATMTCYDRAVENVALEKQMYELQTVDLTWVFLHQIYTVTLTIIWTTYDPQIRKLHPRQEVEGHIGSQIQLLMSLSGLWPGAEAAADLFARLAVVAMRSYDADNKKSPPSTRASVPKTSPVQQQQYRAESHSPQSQTSQHVHSEGSRSVSDTPSPYAASGTLSFDHGCPAGIASSDQTFLQTVASTFRQSSTNLPREASSYRDFQGTMFDPNFVNTVFPQQHHVSQSAPRIPEWLQDWDPPLAPALRNEPQSQSGPSIDFVPRIPTTETMQSYDAHATGDVLNQQAQHDELMNILERDGFDFPSASGQRLWSYDDGGFF